MLGCEVKIFFFNKKKMQIIEEGGKDSKEYIRASIEKWLSSLETKEIIPSTIAQITHFDINNDESKIEVLDAIISTLTQKLLLLTNPTQPKNYALSRHTKHLLLDGYINKYLSSSSQKHSNIPTDLVLIIYKYYDYSLIWKIKDEIMSDFRAAGYRDIMYGPTLEISGATLQITLCPMGWKNKGYMVSYLELTAMGDNINRIGISVVMYIKEFDLLYKAAVQFTKPEGLAANSKLFPYDKVKNIESLTFEYDIEIMYIEYNPKLELEPLILCTVPEITDTEFIWNIDDKLLEEIKNTIPVWFYYSDNFMDNCLANYLKITQEKLWLGLKLLRLPFDVEKYIVSIVSTIYYDNSHIIISREKMESLTMESVSNQTGFKIEKLNEVKVLSFKTEIKVHEIKRR